MELELRRRPSTDRATIGELYSDGVFVCYTLEDVVREIPGRPVREWKIPKVTAIPVGRYRVIVNDSDKFGRALPLLVGVPGYTGVRMHKGNKAEDTDGCILVGTEVAGDTILHSKDAFDPLFDLIQGELEAGNEVWITVKSPESSNG